MSASIELEGGPGYRSGSRVRGTVAWDLDKVEGELELRLFWWTEGKGTRDVGVVRRLAYDAERRGEESFEVELPLSPYSYSGRLLSILWGLELVTSRGVSLVRAELAVGPEARELRAEDARAS